MRSYFLWLFKVITLIVIFFVFVPMIIASLVFIANKGQMRREGKHTVAVVEILGEIRDTKDVIQKLHDQVEDNDIKGIVLRIDSPGGTVAASQDVYSVVKELKKKKPIVVSMGDVAASGGLYSALSASKIFCQPGTLTGSIGVIMQMPNLTKLADTVGVQMTTIKSGALKDVGNPFRPISPDEQNYLTDTIKTVHEDFMGAVSESRGIPLEKVKEFADGRIITGRLAKELGLVDDFGDVYTASKEIFKIKGEPLKEGELPNLYYPEDALSELKRLTALLQTIPKTLNSMLSTHWTIKYALP